MRTALATTLLATICILATCTSQRKSSNEPIDSIAVTDTVSAENTKDSTLYICPMLCEGDSTYHTIAGNCTVCGMDYMEKSEVEEILKRQQ